VAGSVLGIVTGLGTVIGWLASGSFVHGLAVASLWAGRVLWVAGMMLVAAVNVAEIERPRNLAGYFLATWRLVSAGVFIAIGVIPQFRFSDASFRAIAAILLVGIVLIEAAFRWSNRRKRPPSSKTCPDCAETIKAGARVCRYCGYRFDPEETSEPAPPHPRSRR
jgi:hypothetical protein